MTNVIDFPLSTYTPHDEDEELLEAASRQLSDTIREVMHLLEIDTAILSRVAFSYGSVTRNASGEVALMIQFLTTKLAELERVND